MIKIHIENFFLFYSDGTESLKNINLDIPVNAITVLFGPAGGGKSTLLRVINRLNDLADVKQFSGKVLIDGQNILDPDLDVIALRRRIGIVFARPVVLPFSIRKNLTYGLELAGIRQKQQLEEAVERSLQQAALWEEVKDRLDDPAVALSGGLSLVDNSNACVWRAALSLNLKLSFSMSQLPDWTRFRLAR